MSDLVAVLFNDETTAFEMRAARFVLVRKATSDKVLEGLKEFAGKGKILKTSLEKDNEEELREALEKA